MDPLASVAIAVGVYALAVISPGPSFLLVARTSLAKSRRAGLLTALGIASGSFVYAAATLFGLTVVLIYVPALAAAVQILGGLYLAWLGLGMIRGHGARAPQAGSTGPAPAGEGWRAYRQGLVTNLANPKVAAFFVGLFATVISPDMEGWARLAVLAGVTTVDVAWHVALASALSASRAQRLYRRFGGWFDRLFGTLLIVVGAKLVLEARLAR